MVHAWVSKEIFRGKIMRFLQQLKIQFQRQLKIKIYEKSALAIIFLVPLILGIVSGFVFLGNEEIYQFHFNGYYPSFLFMMIITSVFLGLLISIIEIMKERQVINKEKLFGISIYSYYFSKLTVLSIAGLIQTLILYTAGAFILEIPSELFATNILILYIVIFNSITIGLLVSSMAQSLVLAYNMISILVLPQILLGGGFIAYSSMSSQMTATQESVEMPFVAKILPTSWAYEDIVVSNYVKSEDWGRNAAIESLKIKEKNKDEYMGKVKTVSFFSFLKLEIVTLYFNKLILLSQALIAIMATLLALRRRDTKF